MTYPFGDAPRIFPSQNRIGFRRQLKEEEQSARAHRQQAQHTRALLHEGLERSAAVHAKEIADVDAAARMTRLAYIASAQDKVCLRVFCVYFCLCVRVLHFWSASASA